MMNVLCIINVFNKRMGDKERTKKKHFWNAKCVQITTVNSEIVVVYQLVPYSVKVYLILLKAK